MTHPWHDLDPGPEPPDRLTAVIEIPRGSRNKYELDKESGLFRFDRLLYSSVHYPGDYGFIPRSLAEDGDPLDVVVMVTAPTFTGCLLTVRPLGVFRMEDARETDEKILAVPVRDPLFEGVRELDDVAEHFLREMEHFFSIYKQLEGVETTSEGWAARSAARDVITKALEAYER